jgi:hypothetical protein
VLKNFISFIKDWFSIADVLGYIIIFMITCSLWFGYQKTQNLATNARIVAKVKLQDYTKKITSNPKIEIESPNTNNNANTESTSKKTEESKLASYYDKAKEKLSLLNYTGAKNKVKDLNNSLSEMVSEVQTEFLDPRQVSASKSTNNETNKKIETKPVETRDSLSPL